MIAPAGFRDKTIAVLGLARSGRVVADALAAAGANVLAWDDQAASRAAAVGLNLVDLHASDAATWDALVISPGIPLTHPAPHTVAAKAAAAGVEIIGDIELLWRAATGGAFLGITGTNGKSTTTSLIGHILASAGHPVAVGGNLGIPVLSLPAIGAGGHYVIEMSSYQLDLVDQARFAIAILLNVTPDHLDRHGDMAGYCAAKRRIFRHQAAGDTAIVSIDDANCRAIAAGLSDRPARLVPISTEAMAPGGVSVIDGQLIDDLDGTAARVADLTGIANLPGRHNWQNAAAAYAAARAVGLETAAIIAGLASYPGLAHRQELVGRIGAVRFINDSKATNADAAAKALDCYEPIYWIAGGVAKSGGIAPLERFFGKIRHAYLIGTAAEQFSATLEARVPFTHCRDLAEATRAAAEAAAHDPAPAPVVLLSPSCASFDQFANFERRGEAFRAVVNEIVSESIK